MPPFVSAVTASISQRSDDWAINYYMGEKPDQWNENRAKTYMETRRIALGPEWASLQAIIMQMNGDIPRKY